MNEQSKQYQQIIAKCWADEAFKNQLIADSAAVLKAGSMEVPDGVTINVVEDTADSRHFFIPARPESLSDENLDNIAGGVTRVSIGNYTCF